MTRVNSSAGVTYRVVGRYMAGPAVTGYHLLGSDGRQLPVTKERAIYLIGRGLVENMRVQANGKEMIIRGKGVNLNSLPIYDEKRNKFRNNEAYGAIKDSAVKPKKDSGISPMGQVKIIKRIMYKNRCLGYIVVDHSGKERKFSRKQVINLAIQKIVSNATVQKYTPPGKDKPELILRGAGIDLSKLPSVLVDNTGKLIDPQRDRDELKIRAIRMRRGGIVYDKVKNRKIPFEPGDRLVCGIKGTIRPVRASEFEKMFSVDKAGNMAICDDYLDNLKNYPIEIFGSTPREINADQVKKWDIVRAIKEEVSVTS